MNFYFTLLFFLHLSFSNAAEVYFSPSKKCENGIIQQIQKSTKKIRIAVYSISNEAIVESLIQAKSRNVSIKILTDAVQAAGPSSKIPELVQQKFDLKVHSVHKIMHHKFALFDDKVAVTGSFNWTNPASNKNSENCVFFDTKDQNILSAFNQEFERLWDLNSLQKSEKKITALLAKKTRRNVASQK